MEPTETRTQASPGLTSRTAAHRLAAEGPNELPAGRAPRLDRDRGGRARGADVPAAAGGGRDLPRARRRARGARPRRLHAGGHRDHGLPAASHRARARGAARPFEPARARDPGRRGTAHSRAGGRARRRRPAARRRSRSGGRPAARGRGARGRRVAPHRRIASGRQARRSRRASRWGVPGEGSPRCIPARWSCTATASRKFSPPGRAAKSAGSAARSPSIGSEATPLQRETRRVVQALAVAGLALCAIVAIAYGVLRGHWAEAILAGVTLAMGILPEEFPGRPDGLPRARRVAHLEAQRAHAPHAGDRDAGRDHGAVRRQDRHAHREPHARGGARDVRRADRSPRARRGAARSVRAAIARHRRGRERARRLRSDGAGDPARRPTRRRRCEMAPTRR